MTEIEFRFGLWFVLVGALLVSLALSSTVLQRLPLTTALLYLVVGYAIGPAGVGLIQGRPLEESLLLERLTEIVVIVSLFSAGLKLRTPLRDRRWLVPVRLASISMVLTIGMVTVAGVFGLGLPLGAAVLLGAVLAPTDPVLASDVQVEDPTDQDRLRFGLTGEAGLNDGTAFPFVMLGLGLLGLHDLGEWGWRWVLVDVLWAIPGGLAIGALLGTLVGTLIIYLRREHRETVGTDDFLALGLIALSYGAALFAHTYGFLAVFAAGLALRRIERLSTQNTETAEDPPSGRRPGRAAAERWLHRVRGSANQVAEGLDEGASKAQAGESTDDAGPGDQVLPEHLRRDGHAETPPERGADGDPPAGQDDAPAGGEIDVVADPSSEIEIATDAEKAPAHMASSVLGFSEQLERIGTVGVVLLVGGLLANVSPPADTLWFAALLFLVIRPVAVLLGTVGAGIHPVQTGMMSWFGIRGIGSIYYLMYAVEQELPDGIAERLTTTVLAAVAISIVVHGISVTPLMKVYGRWSGKGTDSKP